MNCLFRRRKAERAWIESYAAEAHFNKSISCRGFFSPVRHKKIPNIILFTSDLKPCIRYKHRTLQARTDFRSSESMSCFLRSSSRYRSCHHKAVINIISCCLSLNSILPPLFFLVTAIIFKDFQKSRVINIYISFFRDYPE